MLEELRRLLHAAPFRPFNLHMADGRAFKIGHPEVVMVTKKGIVVVQDDAGYVDLLPGFLITGLKGLDLVSSER
ncbi:MAG TPA: hypothetical protein VF593_13935 [Chthoniobacteraceae bacterium]|jgi:hypothetical protein